MTEPPRKEEIGVALRDVFELFAKDVERNVKRRLDQASPAGAGEVVGERTKAAIAHLADLLSQER